VTLPAGEDPDDIVRPRRAGRAEAAPRRAHGRLERKLQMLEERGFFDDIEGVRRALDRLLPTLRATVDPALRDIYTARVAQRTGVRRETLEHELDRAVARAAAARNRPRRDPRPPRRQGASAGRRAAAADRADHGRRPRREAPQLVAPRTCTTRGTARSTALLGSRSSARG
jgi:DNA primase